MRFTRITAVLLATTLGLGSLAVQARPSGPEDERHSAGAQGRRAAPGSREAASRVQRHEQARHQPGHSPGYPQQRGRHESGRQQPARVQAPVVAQASLPPVVYVTPAHHGVPRPYHEGDRLPPMDGGGYVLIDDWRDHRLDPPPRGQRWVRIGADFALVAIATGVIAQIILGDR